MEPKPTKLKVLPHHMVLASLRKDQLQESTHALLKLMLFSQDNQEHFFSFTETSEEISLVLEENALSFFPAQTLQYTNQIWRIIQIDEGPLGFESTGIVSSISGPLAANHISIYHLSTFLTDHTLVELESLSKAVSTLQEAGFVFTNEELSPPSSPPTTKKSSKEAEATNGKTTQMVITRLPYQLYLARLPENWAEVAVKPLLHLLFFAFHEDRFVSFTLTPSEASLILDNDAIGLFPSEIIEKCEYSWRALQICEGAYGFNESGIVSKFAGPLAEAKISIFNLSTYFTDYALVADKDFDHAMSKLKERFDIITDE